MVIYRIAEMLDAKGMTRYQFAQALVERGLTMPAAYQLTNPEKEGRFGRIEHDTLDKICDVLQAQPGDFLEWIPEKRPRK